MTGKTLFREMEINRTYIREVLLQSINEKVAKNGKPYVELEMSDGDSAIVARKFDTCLTDLTGIGIEEETVVTISVKVSLYNGDKSYTVEEILISDCLDVSIDDFILKADIDIEKTWQQLICNIKCSHTPSSRDEIFEPLSTMTLRILNANKRKFIHSAAGKSVHHNVIGGLLQHTAAMVQEAMFTALNYPSLDKELLVCGAALHDIGKLREMKTSKTGHVEYTSDGRLLGHSSIGIQLIEYYNDVDGSEDFIPDGERVLLLEHLLASHHGSLECGAITEPAIPEAAVLHAIDMMDSRIDIFKKAYKDMDPGEISANIFALRNSAYKTKSKRVQPETPKKSEEKKDTKDINEFFIVGEDDESYDEVPF